MAFIDWVLNHEMRDLILLNAGSVILLAAFAVVCYLNEY